METKNLTGGAIRQNYREQDRQQEIKSIARVLCNCYEERDPEFCKDCTENCFTERLEEATYLYKRRLRKVKERERIILNCEFNYLNNLVPAIFNDLYNIFKYERGRSTSNYLINLKIKELENKYNNVLDTNYNVNHNLNLELEAKERTIAGLTYELTEREAIIERLEKVVDRYISINLELEKKVVKDILSMFTKSCACTFDKTGHPIIQVDPSFPIRVKNKYNLNKEAEEGSENGN